MKATKKVLVLFTLVLSLFIVLAFPRVDAMALVKTESIASTDFSVYSSTLTKWGQYLDGSIQFRSTSQWLYESPDFTLYNPQVARLAVTLPTFQINTRSGFVTVDPSKLFSHNVQVVARQYLTAVEFVIPIPSYTTLATGVYIASNVVDISDYMVVVNFTFSDFWIGDATLASGHRLVNALTLELYDSGIIEAYNAGYQSGLTQEQKEAYNAGYAYGFTTGKTKGHGIGFTEGLASAQEDIEEAFKQGLADGIAEGLAVSQVGAYNQGFRDGQDADEDINLLVQLPAMILGQLWQIAVIFLNFEVFGLSLWALGASIGLVLFAIILIKWLI
jgi:hypothetical protein